MFVQTDKVNGFLHMAGVPDDNNYALHIMKVRVCILTVTSKELFEAHLKR